MLTLRRASTCFHRELHLGYAAEYRCAQCGQEFVALRQERPSDFRALDDRIEDAEDVDVSRQVGRYVTAGRRLPSTCKR